MAMKKFFAWSVKKENMFESAGWRVSLFSFSETEKISSHFNPALIFWLFLIKQKEQINLYKKIF
jgi:hypothetical protein